MMKLRSTKLPLIAATLLAATCAALADPLGKALVGKWDSTSYTVVQQGKPGESVQMKPGTMVFTYRDDGTWVMEAADEGHTTLNGTYALQGSELILMKPDGSTYQDFNVELKSDGKEIVLRDKRSILTATKLETVP
jgi:hypothetical protein